MVRRGGRFRGSRATSPTWSLRRSSWSRGRARSARRDTGAVRPPPRPGHMWNWHDGKVALEYLFFTGQVAAARRVNFERLYDTAERVLPAAILEAPTPSRQTPSASWCGSRPRRSASPPSPTWATTSGCRVPTSKARVTELVDCGELIAVEVEGWAAPAYLWPEARRPRQLHARALLSPFDSLIWFRATDRAAVRVSIPDRDLHAGRQARPRLLRAAVPARRATSSLASISSPTDSKAPCSYRAPSPRKGSTRSA